MTPDELDAIRIRNDTEIIQGTLFDPASQTARDLEAALDHIDELHATIAALRAGQGTPTGDTR